MALSGSTAKQYTPLGAYWVWVEWSATQSIVDNTSTITAIVYGGSNSNGWYTGSTNGSQVTIEGQTDSYGDSGDWQTNTTKRELCRKTLVVAHTADGTKSFSTSGRWYFTGTFDITSGGTFALDTIPRASLITSFPDFNIGSGVTVSAPRFSTSFTNTYTIKVGGTTIASKSGQGDSCAFTGAELDAIYYQFPNTTSGVVTVEVSTWSGGTQIGSTQYDTAVGFVESTIKPTASGLSLTEANTTVLNANLGLTARKFLKSMSTMRFSVTATGIKGSTINRVEWTTGTDELGYTSWLGNPINLTAFAELGLQEVYVTAFDSRGRQSTVLASDLTILDYDYPSVSALSSFRVQTNVSTTPYLLGWYARTQFGGGVSPILDGTNKNQLTYKLEYKLKTGSTYTTLTTATLTVGTVTYSSTPTNYGNGTTYFNPIYAYDFRVTITDKLGYVAVSSIILSTGQVATSWSKNGVGIGKIWAQGALDVEGDIYFNSIKFPHTQRKNASITGTGWYTIAEVPTGRAISKFTIRDDTSSRHNAVSFIASTTFGQTSISWLHGNAFGTVVMTGLRMLYTSADRTYGRIKLQVYCQNPTFNLIVDMDDYAKSSWDAFTLVDPILESAPAGYTEDTASTLYSITSKMRYALSEHTHSGFMVDGGSYGTVTFSNWVRTTGSTGWFNETYAGGIHMTDSTWIRTYNNKSFYCNQTILGNVLEASAGFTAHSGSDVRLRSSSAGVSDTGDLIFQDVNGAELARIYQSSGAPRSRGQGGNYDGVIRNNVNCNIATGTFTLNNATYTSVSFYMTFGGAPTIVISPRNNGTTGTVGTAKTNAITTTGFQAIVTGTAQTYQYDWIAIWSAY